MQPRNSIERAKAAAHINLSDTVKLAPRDIFFLGEEKGKLGPVGEYFKKRLSPVQVVAFNFMQEVYLLQLIQEKSSHMQPGIEKEMLLKAIEMEIQRLIKDYALTPKNKGDKFNSFEDSGELQGTNAQKALCCKTPLDINNFTEIFFEVFKDFQQLSNFRSEGNNYLVETHIKEDLIEAYHEQYSIQQKKATAKISSAVETDEKRLAEYSDKLLTACRKKLMAQEMKDHPEKNPVQKIQQMGEKNLAVLTQRLDAMKISRDKIKSDLQSQSFTYRFVRRFIIRKPRKHQQEVLHNLNAAVECLEKSSQDLRGILDKSLLDKGTDAAGLKESVSGCLEAYKEAIHPIQGKLTELLPPSQKKSPNDSTEALVKPPGSRFNS